MAKTTSKKTTSRKKTTRKAVIKKAAAGKPVTKETIVKTLGKANKLTKSVAERSRSLAPPMTDAKLDIRQMEKGTKRKAFGPKLKISVTSAKMVASRNITNIPPTEVE